MALTLRSDAGPGKPRFRFDARVISAGYFCAGISFGFAATTLLFERPFLKPGKAGAEIARAMGALNTQSILRTEPN